MDWRQVWKGLRFSNVGKRCCRHGVCTEPHADASLAGSPCQFWSSFGGKQGHYDGRLILLLCWCRQVRSHQYTWCLHENVKGFDTGLLSEMLGDLYILETIQVHPADMGWGSMVSRPRLYTILVHREKACLSHSISEVYRQVKERFKSLGALATAADCLLASSASLVEEENRARARRWLSPIDRCSEDWSYLLFGLTAGLLVCDGALGLEN